jgi:2-hydroxy-3-keto-5-methylthiopentenyl-1-phosphate phosphatase
MFHVFCDFDGTITTRDATDFVLERLAAPEWLEIEAMWQRGLIGSAECMRAQVALITAPQRELNETLDEVQVDEGFPVFVAACREAGVPITIISDGVDHFIRYILTRYGLTDIPVIANRLTITPENGYQLDSPWSARACRSAAGVCKCTVVGIEKAQRIFVGDGRSDFCVSDKPEFVFAKGTLAAHCKKHGTEYIPYHNFNDVTTGLQHILKGSKLIKERKRI